MGSVNISAASIPVQIIPIQPPTRGVPAPIQGHTEPTGFLNLIESLIGGEITPPQPTQLATGPAKPPVLVRRGKAGNDADAGTDKKDRKNPRDSQQQDAPTMMTIPANSTQVRPRIYLMAMSISLPAPGQPTDYYVPTKSDETNPIPLDPQKQTVQVVACQVPAITVPVPVAVPMPTAVPVKDQTTVTSNAPKRPGRPQSHEEPEVQPTAGITPSAPVAVAPVTVTVPIAIPAPHAAPVAPGVPIKDTTPVSRVTPRPGDTPKPLTTPSRISNTEETRKPEPVSFQARLTEHEPEPAAPTAPSGTNPIPAADAQPEQIGYVPQKAPPAPEAPPKSKPAAVETTPDVLQPEIKTTPPPIGAVPFSTTPSRPASINEAKSALVDPPPLAASTPVDVPKPAASSSSIREISVRIPTENSTRGVEVQLIEKGGKVEVTVRAGDQQLSSALRSDLADLVRMLDSKGYKTETWTPSDTNPLVHQASSGVAELTRSDTPQDRSNSQQQDSTGGGNTGSNSQQQRRQQQNRPAWLQELERRLGDS